MSASDLLQRLTERSSQAGLDVEPQVASRLVAYYALLEHWNRTINLTSLRNVDDAIDRLLLEPLAAARYLPSQSHSWTSAPAAGPRQSHWRLVSASHRW